MMEYNFNGGINVLYVRRVVLCLIRYFVNLLAVMVLSMFWDRSGASYGPGICTHVVYDSVSIPRCMHMREQYMKCHSLYSLFERVLYIRVLVHG